MVKESKDAAPSKRKGNLRRTSSDHETPAKAAVSVPKTKAASAHVANGESPVAESPAVLTPGGRRKRAIPSSSSPAKAAQSPKKKRLQLGFDQPTPGVVLTLGEGDVGQLGLGPDILDRANPALVTGIPEKAMQVVAGGMHTACVTVTGKVYTYGCNDEGALGRATADSDSETLPGLVSLPEKIVQVSAGDSHTAALSETGRVYAWGTFRDASGSMGLREHGPEKSPVALPCDGNKQVVKVVSGSDHLVCLVEDGVVYTIGCAEQGQLGRVAECFAQRGSRKGLSSLLALQEVHFRTTRGHRKPVIGDIWAGAYVTFAKAKDTGDIYAWGLNNYYQLGIPDMKNRFVPERVEALASDRDWKEIASGQHHTIAVDQSGAVFSTGRGTYGQLGLGTEVTTEGVPAPVQIQSLAAYKCSRVAASSSVSFAVTSIGKVFAWGMNTSKQLGGNDEDDLLEPREMGGKQLEGKQVVMVSSGGQHTVLLVAETVSEGGGIKCQNGN